MSSACAIFRKPILVCVHVGLFLVLTVGIASAAGPKLCGEGGAETLKPYGDKTDNYMTDLKVVGQCDVVSDAGNSNYYFHNVNVVKGGELKFHDDNDTDFYAESIVVEEGGKITAISTQKGFLPRRRKLDEVLPYAKRLTIHLWGAEGDAGIECASTKDSDHGPCGIPKAVWDANPTMADHMEHDQGPPSQKNAPCKSENQYMGGEDCFYRYEVQDKQDRDANRKAYFGHKVLAVSYGGALQLFGSKGVSYIAEQGVCSPTTPGNECNPAFTGTSWARLTSLSADRTKIKINAKVDWAANDIIVLTPTDYLPSHFEERTITAVDENTGELTLDKALEFDHNAKTFPLDGVPANIGPKDDPNVPDIKRAVDTRAAVALLTRNIKIVSEGDKPSDSFPATDYYYGGHTMVRQGFASYRVQGVEFYLLGQGGAKGRYSVHFHMLRKVQQAQSNDKGPLNFLKDCSIHDSMTRWITVHATEGMYIARNVGEKSIGHGFYLEDATETNNKFYGNIGIFARAAINDKTHNPHQSPGILASNQPVNPPMAPNDYMPYRSDYNHPTIFWITNGWNDFQYNFAAGAATCGACYWWLPTGNSGPSQYQYWESYASQQISLDNPTTFPSNYARAGVTPLYKFVGNSCVAAMSSFQMNGSTADCAGVTPPDGSERGLSAVESSAPNGPDARFLNTQPFQLYYPVVTDLHGPTLCSGKDCTGPVANPKCDAPDSFGNCPVTQLDHYTTSFNFAQTNFAAVWLRKGWDLFSNGAVTDVQTGGLNFITGGGYTHSDVSIGEWLLARHSVFIGHSQPPSQNSYALDVGPFNEKSGLKCDTSASDHCEYAVGGMSYNLPAYPGQKMLNIYDGPSHQVNNAYFDITVSPLSDCTHGSGDCKSSAVPLARNDGVLYNDEKAMCYLPNAAIGWKQPNGFFYPPAFHSAELWFKNVDIRHFVVEPLFEKIKIGENNPFQQDQQATDNRYCTRASNMFSQFNHIDRQTVLNDDDGTLTGLIGAVKVGGGTDTSYLKRPSISINEDAYFRSDPASNDRPECLSDIGILPVPSDNDVGTARTSPYEWVATAIYPDCVSTMCFSSDDQKGHWWSDCGNQKCRGVPLYREYLTTEENAERSTYLPQIRMMGQGTGQRSTLTMNRGSYYMDITQSCNAQGECVPCAEVEGDHCKTWGPVTYFPTTFLRGHKYYFYLLYATASTRQTYDMYIGDMKKEDLNITPVYINPQGQPYTTSTPTDPSFVSVADKVVNDKKVDGVVSVTVDLTKQTAIFNENKPLFCKPKSYCEVRGSSCCKIGDPNCNGPENECSWGPHDIDCPIDPKNPDIMRCFGFTFTLPQSPSQDVRPPDALFVPFNDIPYFKNDVVFLQGKSISPKDQCVYTDVPKGRMKTISSR